MDRQRAKHWDTFGTLQLVNPCRDVLVAKDLAVRTFPINGIPDPSARSAMHASAKNTIIISSTADAISAVPLMKKLPIWQSR